MKYFKKALKILLQIIYYCLVGCGIYIALKFCYLEVLPLLNTFLSSLVWKDDYSFILYGCSIALLTYLQQRQSRMQLRDLDRIREDQRRLERHLEEKIEKKFITPRRTHESQNVVDEYYVVGDCPIFMPKELNGEERYRRLLKYSNARAITVDQYAHSLGIATEGEINE